MDANNDYILRLIESASKFIAKVCLHKESKEMENISWDSIDAHDIIPALVKRLTYEGKYNEAEDIIFEELGKNPSAEIYDAAEGFYRTLLSKSDEELEKANFPREEVYSGIADLEKIISDNSAGAVCLRTVL